MARPLSTNSRKVLRQLGRNPKSIDELRVRTGISKTQLAKTLWRLEKLGWVAGGEEVRKLPVFRRVRLAPRTKPARSIPADARTPIADLFAAFGSRLPAKRARGRVVRRAEE